MKKILNLSVISLLFLSIMSCSSDDDKTVATATDAPVLISPQDGTAIVLNKELKENPAITLVWNHSNYDVATEVTYNIQMAVSGTDFATVVDAGSTNKRVYTMTVADLNDKALKAGLKPLEAAKLDVRIVSSLGDNKAMSMISNAISITVTPYSAADPTLFLVGQPQAYYGPDAWKPETGIAMRYIGDGTTKLFEAYVKVGADDGLKFAAVQGSWDDVNAAGNYGKADADGTLKNDGGAGDVKVAATDGDGFYYIQVDLDNLTYKSVKMNWGIIGAATPGGWDGETPMTFDFAANKFKITATLTAGEMKFRAKNAGDFIYASEWKFQVGNSDPKVAYDNGAGNLNTTAGEHNVELEIGIKGAATVSGI